MSLDLIALLDARFSKVDEKQDLTRAEVAEMRVAMAGVQTNLAEHMRRTEIAEESLALHRKDSEARFDRLERGADRLSFVWRLLMGAGALAATVLGYLKLFVER